MLKLDLHELHQGWGAQFIEVNGAEVVERYDDVSLEYAALQEQAGVLDLSFRSRLCLTGADRSRFLHGQVTNDVKKLQRGQGCYAGLVTAKGRTESDLNVYCLADELLLDFEPGLTQAISQRLEKYVIADDVQIVDVGSLYGLLSVQGPRAEDVLNAVAWTKDIPTQPFSFSKFSISDGEGYLMNQPRLGSRGYDLFLPMACLGESLEQLVACAKKMGGRAVGWQAFEISRVEAGIPRFGADFDGTNIPLEAGIEKRAISFNKGCYIGQEVISRIKTYSEVSKSLRGLRFAAGDKLPAAGDKLYQNGKEVGYITSVVESPKCNCPIALGYVRKEVNSADAQLIARAAAGEIAAKITELPF